MNIKLLGIASKEVLEEQLKICAAAGKLSRMAGTVFDALDFFENNPEKALNFIKRVIGMGHTSTIDHDYMVFAISDVSPVVEQTIIAERYSSFTIKSRREVDFSKVGFYVPDFHDTEGNELPNKDELKEKYINHMNSLFADYQKFIDIGISKEDARFVLPYSYHSQILMGLDGTSLAKMIIKLTKTKYSKIDELREFGEKLYQIAQTRSPYIDAVIEREIKKTNSDTEDILNNLGFEKEYNLVKNPVLLSATDNLDQTIFVNAIARIYGKSIDDATKLYEQKIKGNQELEEKLMKSIFDEVNQEDLRQINLRFQLAIPYAILTHYTRHRRLSLSIPDFAPLVDMKLYITPPSIANSSLNTLYNDLYERNNLVLNAFKSAGVRDEDLVYFTLSGNAVNVIINFDGEAFRWICRLRECTKAQWCIREAVTKMHKLVDGVSKYYSANIGPDCVTKHICGEGKESCGRIEAILKRLKK